MLGRRKNSAPITNEKTAITGKAINSPSSNKLTLPTRYLPFFLCRFLRLRHGPEPRFPSCLVRIGFGGLRLGVSRITKENGETGFPISPLRTHLRQAFVALAAGRGWPQPRRAASDQWTARSPLATTIYGARPIHAHGPFVSDPSTGFPSAAPSREGVRRLVEDDFARHSRGPSAAFATARHLTVPLSARCSPLVAAIHRTS